MSCVPPRRGWIADPPRTYVCRGWQERAVPLLAADRKGSDLLDAAGTIRPPRIHLAASRRPFKSVATASCTRSAWRRGAPSPRSPRSAESWAAARLGCSRDPAVPPRQRRPTPPLTRMHAARSRGGAGGSTKTRFRHTACMLHCVLGAATRPEAGCRCASPSASRRIASHRTVHQVGVPRRYFGAGRLSPAGCVIGSGGLGPRLGPARGLPTAPTTL